MAATLHALPATVAAQGVAGGGIRGTVRATDSSLVDGARVQVMHAGTGWAVEVEARRGRFLVQGLEPGGPYVVTVRRPGFAPRAAATLTLALGELRELPVVLEPVAMELDTVRIEGAVADAASIAGGGAATTIDEALLARLPTLNRNFHDFVRLVPQVSTRIGLAGAGFSAGGAGFRFNNFLINGVSERTLNASVPIAFAGTRSIPFDAVREYQVLLAPYDVRFGDFAGALVDAITRSGTNAPHGTAFVHGRNDGLARHTNGSATFDRLQYGASLGGPVVRDRVHVFVATELQRLGTLADGPYVGQPADAGFAVPVAPADLARLDSIMRGWGLVAGSAGRTENAAPKRSLFARVDVALPAWRSRAFAWGSYAGSEEEAFSRHETFALSSYQAARVARTWLGAIHLHTALPRGGGGHNALVLSHRVESLGGSSDVSQPIVRVLLPGITGGRVLVATGTNELAQGGRLGGTAIGLKDNLVLPVGVAHVLTAGVEVELFRLRRRGVFNEWGAWTFTSLDELAAGIADSYEVGRDYGSASTPLDGAQWAAYVGDEWRPHARLTVTAGVRGDLLALEGRAPFSADVDSIFDRRTDANPRRRLEPAPRAGFTWDVAGDGRHRLRGGAGLFVSRYPLAWAQTARASWGGGVGSLRCGHAPTDVAPAPVFEPDLRARPSACADGSGIAETRRGDVDLLDPGLRMLRVARGSVAYDRKLPAGTRFTGEVVRSRGLSDFAFQNLNLGEPTTTDRNGRVLYGTLDTAGVSVPARRSKFSEVIDLRNAGRSDAWQLSARIERSFARRVGGAASYTYSRVRDAQTPLRVNTTGTVNWSSARVLAGRQDDLTPGISSNDIPHRVVLSGAFATSRGRWRTDLAFHYVGESGRPFTYVARGTARRGDLNADGSASNDPVYVPRSAMDTTEIRLDDAGGAGAAQRAALESLIEGTTCLRRQRGRIMARNSCREPWSSTTIASLRQSIPIRDRPIEVQLDAFNVLNLLSARWGVRREARPALLEHVGQTAGPVTTSQAIFHFDATAPRWKPAVVESAFQLQLALRYRF